MQTTLNAIHPSRTLSRGVGITALLLALNACSTKAMQTNPLAAGSGASGSQPTQAGSSAGSTAAGRGGAATTSGADGGGTAGRVGNAGRGAGPATPPDEADSGTESPDAGGPRAPDAAAAGAGAPPTVTCPGDALEPGESRAMLNHGGRMREYVIYVPRGYDNTRPVPLVLNFHGNTMTAPQQRDWSGMNATADAKGFVVIYPQGIANGWNAGACCGEPVTENVDDVGFTRALLAAVQAKLCIDPHRIYAAGFSNGGRMTYRLGCEMADVFAALAPVAGTKSFPDTQNTPGCMPAKPISLIDFMGSADSRIAAQPGQIKEWVAFNGCTDAMPTESYRNGRHFCSTYSQCKDGTSVTYCVVDGGAHCWPGSYPCLLGNTSRPEELSANELLWKLFERSTR